MSYGVSHEDTKNLVTKPDSQHDAHARHGRSTTPKCKDRLNLCAYVATCMKLPVISESNNRYSVGNSLTQSDADAFCSLVNQALLCQQL